MEEKNNNVNEESLKEKEISNKEEIKTEKSVLEEKTLYERNDVNNFDALYETSVNNQTNFSTIYNGNYFSFIVCFWK